MKAVFGFCLVTLASLLGCTFDAQELRTPGRLTSDASQAGDGVGGDDGSPRDDSPQGSTIGDALSDTPGQGGAAGSGGLTGAGAAGGASGSDSGADGGKDTGLVGTLDAQQSEAADAPSGSGVTSDGGGQTSTGGVAGSGGAVSSGGMQSTGGTATGGTIGAGGETVAGGASGGRSTTGGASTGTFATGGSSGQAYTVDTIDPAPMTNETAGTNTTGAKFNYYTTSAARTLVQIEMFMNPTTSTSLTWYVFESASTSGPWVSILPATTTTSTTGQGYQSSGPISVQLDAGHYYAIGVQWATPVGYWVHESGPVAVSFGTMTGGYGYSETTTPPTITYVASPTNYFAQRLTTM